jgi:hypothetical protein
MRLTLHTGTGAVEPVSVPVYAKWRILLLGVLVKITIKAACLTIFAISTVALSAQCGGLYDLVIDKPFRAEAHCRFVQTLNNGTRVVNETGGIQARDSLGRTYVDGNSGPRKPTIFNVRDPTNGTDMRWQRTSEIEIEALAARGEDQPPNYRIAVVDHFPAVKSAPESAEDEFTCPVEPLEGLECEDLGTKTISGLVAHGVLRHKTVKPGEFGNEGPLVLTSEYWFSRELSIVVSETRNDPRHGDYTMQLENIDRTEPPASLFEVPAGYTIRDHPAEQQ